MLEKPTFYVLLAYDLCDYFCENLQNFFDRIAIIDEQTLESIKLRLEYFDESTKEIIMSQLLGSGGLIHDEIAVHDIGFIPQINLPKTYSEVVSPQKPEIITLRANDRDILEFFYKEETANHYIYESSVITIETPSYPILGYIASSASYGGAFSFLYFLYSAYINSRHRKALVQFCVDPICSKIRWIELDTFINEAGNYETAPFTADDNYFIDYAAVPNIVIISRVEPLSTVLKRVEYRGYTNYIEKGKRYTVEIPNPRFIVNSTKAVKVKRC